MAVYHILKDGTQLTDITGHIVKIEDAEPLYRFLDNVNHQRRKTGRSWTDIHTEKQSEHLAKAR